MLLDKENTNYNGYDIIIAYINSRTYNNNNQENNDKEKKDLIIPYINRNHIIYTEKTYCFFAIMYT